MRTLQVIPPSMLGPAFALQTEQEMTLLALLQSQAPSFLTEILDNNGEINRYVQCYLDGQLIYHLNCLVPEKGGKLDILTSLSGG